MPRLLLMLGLLTAWQGPVAETARDVRGTVASEDGVRVEAASVTLTCGAWAQSRATDGEGTFAFGGVPPGPCRLRVVAPKRRGEGVDIVLETFDERPLQVVLPSSLLVDTSVSGPLRFDLSHTSSTTTERRPLGLDLATQWRAGAAGNATPLITMPPVRPAWQDWSILVGARRPGPFGTLFVGSAGVRRTPGPVSLLSDATGMPITGGTAWSSLIDPTRSPTIWDVRMRLERQFALPGADLILFGEGYQSFEASPARDAAPAVPGTKAPARTGRAVRGGAIIRWE